jgi:hypothetical protein
MTIIKHSERLITRLEHAGSLLSAATEPLQGTGGEFIPLGDAIRRVNIMTADIRRAVVRIEHGEQCAVVLAEYHDKWAEEITADKRGY